MTQGPPNSGREGWWCAGGGGGTGGLTGGGGYEWARCEARLAVRSGRDLSFTLYKDPQSVVTYFTKG